MRAFILSLFILTFGVASHSTSAQQPFYTYSFSTLMVKDTVEVMAVKFRLPITRTDDFWEFWEDEMDDLAGGDFDDNDMRTIGEEVELSDDNETEYTIYTRVQDVHDSIQIKLAFEGPNGFVNRRNTPDLTEFEAAAKLWVTRTFRAYKNDELDEREEILEDAEDEVKDLQEKIRKANVDIHDKQEKIRERQADIAEARTQNANHGEQLAQFRRTLGNIPLSQEEEREDLEDEIEELEDRQERLQRNVRNWEEDILEMEKEIGELRIEISEVELELTRANATLQSAREIYTRLKAEVLSYRIE